MRRSRLPASADGVTVVAPMVNAAIAAIAKVNSRFIGFLLDCATELLFRSRFLQGAGSRITSLCALLKRISALSKQHLITNR